MTLDRRRPQVSICIPAHQAGRYLSETLRSVLEQDWPDFEVVVLDNASTDRTASILAAVVDPRLRIERNTHRLELPDNWNRAVELSRGELIKLVCADDLIRRDAIGMQAQALLADDGLALVASRRHVVDEDGAILVADRGLRGLLGRRDGRAVARAVVRSGGNPIGEPAVAMFRRADFDAVGGFDGALQFPMDLELWMRLVGRGGFLGQRESLAAFRISRSSLSSSVSRAQYEEQRTLTERIAGDPRWQVSRADRAVSQLRAPLAKGRRHLLFAASRMAARL
jgi:glycosyltransferase involved in cell wall biosynthesis